ncbi:MAG: hypothetical protein ACHP79_10340, partial [Terriglobales bacterium]
VNEVNALGASVLFAELYEVMSRAPRPAEAGFQLRVPSEYIPGVKGQAVGGALWVSMLPEDSSFATTFGWRGP